MAADFSIELLPTMLQHAAAPCWLVAATSSAAATRWHSWQFNEHDLLIIMHILMTSAHCQTNANTDDQELQVGLKQSSSGWGRGNHCWGTSMLLQKRCSWNLADGA